MGAIAEITVPAPADKRNFSASAAVGWLADEKTGGAYHIELFENPKAANRTPEKSRGRLAETFEDLVRQLGPGVQAWRLPKAGGLSLVGLRVSDQSAAPRIAAPAAARSLPANVSKDLSRHQSVLDAIARHPAVRRISLPLRLEISEANLGPSTAAAKLAAKDPLRRYPKVGVVDTGLGPALGDWVVGRHDFLHVDDVDPEP